MVDNNFDFDFVFGTPKGKKVLKTIFEESAYGEPEIVLENGTNKVNEKAMIYNAGLRAMYLFIRKNIKSKEILDEIERR